MTSSTSAVDQVLEGLMTTLIGFDLHRAPLTYDALDISTGETKSARIRPAQP